MEVSASSGTGSSVDASVAVSPSPLVPVAAAIAIPPVITVAASSSSSTTTSAGAGASAGAGIGIGGSAHGYQAVPSSSPSAAATVHHSAFAAPDEKKSSERKDHVELHIRGDPVSSSSSSGAGVVATGPQPKEDLHELATTSCQGACRFNCMAFWFLIICAVLPFAILLPMALSSTGSTATSYYIALGVIAGVMTCYLCWSIRRVIIGGVCCVPEPPKQTGPLSQAGDTRRTEQIRRIYIVVNPFGGLKKGLTILNDVALPIFKQHNIEVTVLRTEYAGHAKDYGRTVDLAGYDGLCVIGGDGSFHELVNGYLQRPAPRPDVSIGLIPGGSGNSVGMDLGFQNVKDAVQRIAAGGTVMVDVNSVTDDGKLARNPVYSINELSWGLIGDVGVVSEACRCFGPARYDICGVWGVLKGILYKSQITMVLADGTEKKESGDFVTAFVNQTQHFGKGLRATPLAKIDDGLMDLCFMKKGTRGEQLEVFLQLPSGAHHKHSGLEFNQVRSIALTPEHKSGILNIDGELVRYDGTIRVTCVHRAFRMFIPADCKGPLPK